MVPKVQSAPAPLTVGALSRATQREEAEAAEIAARDVGTVVVPPAFQSVARVVPVEKRNSSIGGRHRSRPSSTMDASKPPTSKPRSSALEPASHLVTQSKTEAAHQAPVVAGKPPRSSSPEFVAVIRDDPPANYAPLDTFASPAIASSSSRPRRTRAQGQSDDVVDSTTAESRPNPGVGTVIVPSAFQGDANVVAGEKRQSRPISRTGSESVPTAFVDTSRNSASASNNDDWLPPPPPPAPAPGGAEPKPTMTRRISFGHQASMITPDRATKQPSIRASTGQQRSILKNRTAVEPLAERVHDTPAPPPLTDDPSLFVDPVFMNSQRFADEGSDSELF